MAKTVSSYNTMFCSQYSINTADTKSGLPGVLYGMPSCVSGLSISLPAPSLVGRYQGDTYAGGNPWVLATAALGSLSEYRHHSSALLL